MVEEIEVKISKHAKQRYAERILGITSDVEVNNYINQNEEKIQKDISKMIQYGNLIYSGKQCNKEKRTNKVNVYSKDCWIILYDTESKNVITLYKIDLGAGDNFNIEYINKMIEKILILQEELKVISEDISKESKTYKDIISDYNYQIAEYRSNVKNLEKLIAAYQEILQNNTVKIEQHNQKIADVVNKLIGKKEF